MKQSLSTKFFIVIAAMLVLLSSGILALVWFTTSNHIDRQADKEILAAQKVFEQLIGNIESQLFISSGVLTDDFAFKRAVATGDKPTILSVLDNQRRRINANLMMLLDLSGTPLSSTPIFHGWQQLDINKKLTQSALEKGGIISFIRTNERLYLAVLVSVNTPKPSAIALVGFEIDRNFIANLTAITGLEVTIINKNQEDVFQVGSRKEPYSAETLLMLNSVNTLFYKHKINGKSYLSRQISLKNTSNTSAVLSYNLDTQLDEFNKLLVTIIAISIFFLIASLYIVAMLVRKIVYPLNLLSHKSVAIANGKDDDELNIDGNTIEMNMLIESFNEMARQINQREKKILYQMNHDLVTNIPNKSAFTQALKQAFNEQLCYVVISIKLDDIENISDTYGYDIGNDYIKGLANRQNNIAKFSAILERQQLVSLVLINSDSQQCEISIDQTLETFEHTLTETMVLSDIAIDPQLSFVMIPLWESKIEPEDVLKKINLSHNFATERKLQWLRYSHEIEKKHLDKLHIVKRLRLELMSTSEEFSIVYQPKIDNKNNQVQAEALLRWQCKELGFVSPEVFIPIAEQAGLINDITYLVIKRVIQDLNKWRELGVHQTVAINLSVQDIHNPKLLPFIIKSLKVFKLNASCLSFEIIESELMENPRQAASNMQRYRDAGFSLAIDDFGTGYSSLSYLKFMPVDELKIDKSFVMTLNKDVNDQNIVKTIIGLANSLNLKTVAEGVENSDSLEILKAYGCDWSQGFHISKPLPFETYTQWYNGYKQP